MSAKKISPFGAKQKKSRFSRMEDRLNLQEIGHHICDGGDLVTIQQSNFEERERNAEQQLERELNKLFHKGIVDELLPIIHDYCFVGKSIHFSLGMKAGAKLLILLTDNFETDI